MRLWLLSHRRPTKAQTSLRIRAISPEPSLFADISMEVDEGWLVVLRLNVPVNNFSVMSGRSHRFLGN